MATRTLQERFVVIFRTTGKSGGNWLGRRRLFIDSKRQRTSHLEGNRRRRLVIMGADDADPSFTIVRSAKESAELESQKQGNEVATDDEFRLS
jgi:hypothetical protein